MIYNAIQLIGHEYCMYVQQAMCVHVCEREIGLVLLNRYLSHAFHNGHLSFDDVHLLTNQVKLAWVLCLILSIKLQDDFHHPLSFYAHKVYIPLKVLVSNEVNVFMYLIKHSKLHVDAEDIFVMRRQIGTRTLTKFGILEPYHCIPDTSHQFMTTRSSSSLNTAHHSRSPHIVFDRPNWWKMIWKRLNNHNID